MAAHAETAQETAKRRMALRKLHKKLARQIPDGEDVAHLNITAMMDMMTIILVFFLKSFSTQSTNVNISPELGLPRSTTQIQPHQAVTLTVTSNAIMVEEVEVASVKRGRVDASIKRDGENGFFINSVFETLDKHKARLQKLEELSGGGQPFRGEISVICDKRTPFRLLTEVLYTAGQAEFDKYRLLVLTKGDEK